MAALSMKNLFEEKIKFSVSIITVGLAVMLVMVLLGVYFGSIKQARSLPENSGADYWVIQEGSRDMFHTVSLLPADKEQALTDLPSITKAGGVINSPTNVIINGSAVTAGIIGFDDETNYLLPKFMINGTNDIDDDGAVIDKALARKHGVSVGEKIDISGHTFKVQGISEKSNAIAFQYIFIKNDSARMLDEGRENLVNYYAVELSDDIETAKEEVASIMPQATIRTTEEMANENAVVIRDSFLVILVLLVAIGVFVSTLVIGLTVYNYTNSKLNEFGVLRAIGMNKKRLFRLVIIQSLVTGLAGLVVGLFFYQNVSVYSPVIIPSIEFTMPDLYIYLVSAGTITSAIFASLISVIKLNRIDPVKVFNA
ncbi:MAG: ABC transporter permease [bacterium]|nr:ABC transporter permease [bacterium]